MTIQRKQKQEVRAFMAEHDVSYQEALRLLDLKDPLWATITDTDGTEYTIWVRGDHLDVIVAPGTVEQAAFQASLWRWMTRYFPGDPTGELRGSFYAPDGRVQSSVGHPSLYELDEMPWLPASVPPLVRAYIRKNFPAWRLYSRSDLLAISYVEANPHPDGIYAQLFPRNPAPPVELS